MWLTKALALMGDLVNEDLGTNDGPKWFKQVIEISVCKVLWKVVDEKVAALRSLLLGRRLLGWLQLLERVAI